MVKLLFNQPRRSPIPPNSILSENVKVNGEAPSGIYKRPTTMTIICCVVNDDLVPSSTLKATN